MSYVNTLGTNGPFGLREDSTEYALIVDGNIHTDHCGRAITYPTHVEAVYAAQWFRQLGAEVHLMHRRVRRESFYTTTG